MIKVSKNITTKEQYLKQVSYLENLAKKGESNLSAKEINDINAIAIAVEQFEDEHLMTEKNTPYKTRKTKKVPRPSLIEIVEFTMFKNKLTQVKLAKLLGQPASKVSKILNKQRTPDVSFLKAIHEKLNVDGNFILESV